MLTGALVGLVVGVVMVIVRSVQGGNAFALFKQAMAARKTGGPAAGRAILEPKLKKGTIARTAGLALIEDREGIEAELAGMTDPVKHGFQRAFALFALAALGDQRRLQEFDAVAERFEREAPKLWKIPREGLKDLKLMARVVGGAPSTEGDKARPDIAALRDPWAKLFLWDVTARGFERDGRTDVAANARMRTKGLDETRRAA
ncbi:MAG: hypothetical protein JO257_33400 [Deltaproteobacteria bacterium]|nr:hypothetical protein [Deltaproteobacteria bacterium]